MAKSTTQTFNEEEKGDLNDLLMLKKGYRKIDLYALMMNLHFMLHVMYDVYLSNYVNIYS